MIKIEDAKVIIRCIVDECKVMFITIWPTAELGRIQIEFSIGSKVCFIKKGQFVHLQTKLKEISFQITEDEASYMAYIINQHLEIF